MVKGISRRVIVVESPDPRVFDQAIFILRNDVLGEDGVSSRQLVNQAVRIAKSYTRSQGLPPPKRHRITPAIAAQPVKNPETIITSPDRTNTNPHSRWVFFQTVSLASVQGVRIPKV